MTRYEQIIEPHKALLSAAEIEILEEMIEAEMEFVKVCIVFRGSEIKIHTDRQALLRKILGFYGLAPSKL